MITTDSTGKSVLTFEVTGIIRRIPVERRGTSKRGYEWTLGGVLLEVFDAEADGSAQLYLNAWGDEMVERINMLGVGKKVKARFHIESSEHFDKFSSQIILEEIGGLSDAEDFLYGRKKEDR